MPFERLPTSGPKTPSLDAEGVESKTPKASRKWEWGVGENSRKTLSTMRVLASDGCHEGSNVPSSGFRSAAVDQER